MRLTSDRTQTVVVDTNVIAFGAWRLDSPAWTVLLHRSKSGHIRLVVPELVVRETVGRFRHEVARGHDAAVKSIKKFNRLAPSEAIKPPSLDVTDVVQRYEHDLRARLAHFHVEIAPLPQFDLDDMLDRAIYRRRPFDPNGSGFRDALLWENVVSLVQSSTDVETVFISNDGWAYGSDDDSKELSPELRADLNNRGIQGDVRLVTSISDYFDHEEIDPAQNTLLLQAIEAQQAELVEQTRRMLQGYELHSRWPAVSAHIESLEGIVVSLDRVHASPERDSPWLVQITATTTASIEIRREHEEKADIHRVTVTLRVPGTTTYTPGEERVASLHLDLPRAEDVEPVAEEIRNAHIRDDIAAILFPEASEAARRAFSTPNEHLQDAIGQWLLAPNEAMQEAARQALWEPAEELHETIRRLLSDPLEQLQKTARQALSEPLEKIQEQLDRIRPVGTDWPGSGASIRPVNELPSTPDDNAAGMDDPDASLDTDDQPSNDIASTD